MATTRVLVTCPECRLQIQFDHALTQVKDEDGSTKYLIDRRAMGMHDCLRDEK
jgi:hypothetical protein